jgi:hypothetical protein
MTLTFACGFETSRNFRQGQLIRYLYGLKLSIPNNWKSN